MSLNEKHSARSNARSNAGRRKWLTALAVASLVIAPQVVLPLKNGISRVLGHSAGSLEQTTTPIDISKIEYDPVCPIVDYYRPPTYEKFKDSVLKNIIQGEQFRNSSIEKLAGAVRIRTETHDEDPQVDEDPEYWAKFAVFEAYLKDTFPVFYEHTSLEKINSHGLIYTWKGSNSTLKPLILMLHQDTVPVPPDTVSGWKYPPFEAHYDGSHLWGRGVADCKNLLIGLLEASEELIGAGFEPKRTVIFSFGFDEEVGGRNFNADRLLELYGKDSAYAVVDEGGISLTELGGTKMLLPGTGEKGSININIQLTTPGGHSSVPPDHTSIGIISDLITEIEAHPFEPIFTDANPTFRQYRCMAEHSHDIEPEFKYDIIEAGSNELANKRVRDKIDQDRFLKYYIKTSQLIDIIRGGAKSNALPESVVVTINHRVAIETKVEEVVAKILHQVKQIAAKYDLGVLAKKQSSYSEPDLDQELFTVIEPTSNGYFTFLPGHALESAPVTPINDAHWDLFAGNIRHVYEEVAGGFSEPIVVSPGIATGNTDTRLYWDLTKHIYRYRPGITPTVETNAHGINENIDFDSHLQIIAFYFEYIQSVDAVLD